MPDVVESATYRMPLAALFPLVFLAVILLHITLLRLPYYWDEGGYYIPAAWDFWRIGTLIPQSTMSNAHPPLPMVLLAMWWKLTGFRIVSTRIFLCAITSTALVGVYRMARTLAGHAVALTVMVLTAIYPVWFAQSTLAHADMFAAAATLWALSFYVDRPGWVLDGRGHSASPFAAGAWFRTVSVAGCFSAAVLSKETAIVLPATLFCLEAWFWFQSRRQSEGQSLGGGISPAGHLRLLVALAFPVLPLIAWYAYHHAKTGFAFGNPEYLRYNATANLSAARVLLSMWHRLIHLTVHMELFVPTLLTLAALLAPIRPDQNRLARGAVWMLGTLLAAQWVAFSILGGALLTRYLLPAYPMVLLLLVVTWKQRVTLWSILAVFSLTAFAVGCEFNPPYPFAPEDNLAYRDMIVLHQHAIRQLETRYPCATVLSAWPVTADLQRPELGYVTNPVKTEQIDNFTPEQLAKAAQEPGHYDTALVFSTKYNPPPGGLNLAASPSARDARYFDAHRDMLPEEIARALGGKVIWQEERNGQWAALLHFDRSYDALLATQLRVR